ncbi:hypothetical protein [Flammeovirga sp. SJP92]|uniref:hypothetical protein n=1 Tax=Flammeovirga sp. SJP92 TaxID=1775430 RepID=UPI0007883A6A|nr:hypothetical protein [Flammeovirga sp. SJP92]KXX72725.1 hypothetical protein AVL50_32005 [Flammeovirga sp. SJP92]
MISNRSIIENNEFIRKLKKNIHFDIKEKFLEEFKKGTVQFQKKQISVMLNVNSRTLNYHFKRLGYDSKKLLTRADIADFLEEMYGIKLLEED